MTGKLATISQSGLFWATVGLVIGYASYWWGKRRVINKVPTKWQQVGEVGQLILYPLKSGRGEEIKEADFTELGLKTTDGSPVELRNLRDRFFIIYHAEKNTFVTCRTYPSLLLVKTTSAGDMFTFTAPGMPQLKLEISKVLSASGKSKVSMWFGEELDATDCGDEAAKWICEYLKKEGTPLRFGVHQASPNGDRRNTDKPPWNKFKRYYKRLRNEYTGAFADLASYMLMSESSVNDLKSKLPEHLQNIQPKQFRPNIVVKGSKPYTEDKWDWIKIGDDVVMRGFKPCTRCTVTTLDPETGIREPQMEPLRTMKTYRQVKEAAAKELEGDAPVMGLYLGLHTTGRVKIGDPVYIGMP